MDKLKQLGEQVKKVKTYWKTPPPGRHMDFKEICAYSFGGMGVYAVMVVINSMILSTGNTLIGNTIGIDPKRLYILYLIATVASIPLTALRANIIDNSRSRDGKYRPFILKMGIPAVILSIGFVWMPYAKMTMLLKCITVLLFNIGFQFFFNFYRDSYENLIFVLSPDSQERTDVSAFKSLIYSIAPTIINIIMPLLAQAITKGNLNDMKLYKFAYPPIATIGILLSVIVYAHTREKTVQAKTHIVQVKFIDALREVAKNKYFWIIACAGWVGFLEGAVNTILYWLYQYTGACTPAVYSMITFIYGTAYTWGMIAAPFAAKRYGKKAIIITTNFFNIIFLLAIYPVVNNIWYTLVCMYLNAFVSSFWVVLGPSVQADIRDYQHYVSGERIDGMFAAVGLIGSFIGIVTSGVLPEIYAAGGIALEEAQKMFNDPAISGRVLAGSGLTVAETITVRAKSMGVTPFEALNAYDALYNPVIFEKLMKVLSVASALGATFNLIPYLFYDLTEIKQRGVVAVLKIRAFFEDYSNGLLEDERYIETIDIIDNARALYGTEPLHCAKDNYKKIKRDKTSAKADKKAAKKACRDEVEHNRQLQISTFIIKEIDKFKDGALDEELELAKRIVNAGLNGLENYSPEYLLKAKAMPKSTPSEKERRKNAIKTAKLLKISSKTIKKYFASGLKSFDMSEYTYLFELDDELQDKIIALYNDIGNCKKQKNKAQIKSDKLEIGRLKSQRKKLNKNIKALSDKNALYHRAAKPYIDSQKLLKQYDDYSKYDVIHESYDEIKGRAQSKVQL